jgi:hypothetical protein
MIDRSSRRAFLKAGTSAAAGLLARSASADNVFKESGDSDRLTPLPRVRAPEPGRFSRAGGNQCALS